MKLRTLIVATGVSLFCLQATAETKPAAVPAIPAAKSATPNPVNASALKTEKEKVSYAIGIDLGENFKHQSIDVDPTLLSQGIKDALSGAQPQMTIKEREETLQNFQKQFRAKQQAEFQQTSAKNLQAGTTYLAANKAKPGVVTTPSGLEYLVVVPGSGAQPTDKDIVTVNYEGTLINGKVFDSSYKRGKPVTFAVSDVIPGWKEALKLMKVGSTWNIVVPANLAYGERGLGGPIGPNETLLFKINLISINSPATASTSKAPATTVKK